MSETLSTESSTPSVSEAWKVKFDILQKMGAGEQFLYKAMGSAEYKGLSFRERNKISFNILAFLFGSLYYFSKKMWAKGAAILGVTWALATLLTLVEFIIGFEFPAVAYWIPSSVFCAQLANYDYFRKVMYGENMWGGWPSMLSKPVGAIGFPLLALVLLFGIVMLGPVPVPKCSDTETTNLIKQIADREMGNQLGAEATKMFSYTIGAIRTTNTNEQTGAYECAAELSIITSNTGQANEIPITYTVEMADNGKEFYVSVLGL
ncbi:DUF2628 domain-containing protein [Nitrincola iocasae]|nr:DUF2628 domain-containing protein [Nitrincola iocasae]